MLRKIKSIKAFMLSEVLIVILIISVLALIIVPSYKRAIEKTRATYAVSTLGYIAKAQKSYFIKEEKYAKEMFDLSLNIKDKDGVEVMGKQFEDKYFNYEIYGSPKKTTIAKRNNGDYELSVRYETGEICCKAFDNSICAVLNIEEKNCSSGIVWGPCEGQLNDLFNTWSGVTYDNEDNASFCQIAFDEDNSDRIDFEICTKHLGVYKFGLSTTGISGGSSGKCFKGHFSAGDENKMVFNYCDNLEDCLKENRSASIYYVRDDYHIVVHCPRYNFEEERCLNYDPKQQRIYKYVNKHNPDLFVEESFAYCKEFDERNVCINLDCIKGNCDFY
ncbi:MAG: hypothetical protein II972_00835 [Elusimicrobiaceae bacterium]|nr:hypothetical protein [Elusimicrobiaceae bacterium]